MFVGALACRVPKTILSDMTPQSPPTDGLSVAATRCAALLRNLGATHVVTVPDNTSALILAALEREGLASPKTADATAPGPAAGPAPPRVIYATREGEVMGLASGLWLGGALPVVLIQNTGLLEAGDGLRGTAARMGVPLLMLITCRGFAKARGAGVDLGSGNVDRDILVRNDLDSVAHMTETTLRAWGIPFRYFRDSSDLTPIEEAFSQAQQDERPVAVLLDASFD